MAYLIGYLAGCCVFGFITKTIAESKGYDGGFWWGFWLGFIGILVVGFRADIRNQNRMYSSSELPAWASSSPAAANPTHTSGWKCVCGSQNPSSVEYCLACRRSKSEGNIPKKICPHCGAGNKATNELCFACNKPLDGSEENEVRPVRRRRAAANIEEPKAETNSEVSTDYISVLEGLGKLRDQGIITEEEFQAKKTEILAKM